MSSPASELRNRVTGEVVDAANASAAEWRPETESDSETTVPSDVEFVTNEETQQQTETESDSEEQTETETEAETSDTEGNDGDNEGQTEEDEEEDEEENEPEEDEQEDEQEDEELEEDEPTSKRYVILEDGKPVVVVVNNPRSEQPPFPTSITIMFIVVFALIFLDNMCKLCALLTHDKCLVRMP